MNEPPTHEKGAAHTGTARFYDDLHFTLLYDFSYVCMTGRAARINLFTLERIRDPRTCNAWTEESLTAPGTEWHGDDGKRKTQA